MYKMKIFKNNGTPPCLEDEINTWLASMDNSIEITAVIESCKDCSILVFYRVLT